MKEHISFTMLFTRPSLWHHLTFETQLYIRKHTKEARLFVPIDVLTTLRNFQTLNGLLTFFWQRSSALTGPQGESADFDRTAVPVTNC